MRITLLALLLLLSSCGKSIAQVSDLPAIAAALGEGIKNAPASLNSNQQVYEKVYIPAYESCGFDHSKSVCHFAYLFKSQSCTREEMVALMQLSMSGVLPSDDIMSTKYDCLGGQMKQGWVQPQDYLDHFLRPQLTAKTPADASQALKSVAEGLLQREMITTEQFTSLKF